MSDGSSPRKSERQTSPTRKQGKASIPRLRVGLVWEPSMNLMTLVFVMPMTPTAEPAVADLIFTNGKVWTVDRDQPEAEAIAIWRARILHVGTSAEVQKLTGPKTRSIDLKGRRVVPGFYDSHVHVLSAGMLLSQVNLKDARDEAEFGERLKKFDRELPKDRWIIGGNWDHDRTFSGKLPT